MNLSTALSLGLIERDHPMHLPTVKRMVSLGFKQAEAEQIRKLMEIFREKCPWGDKRPTITLEKINTIMDGCGVETIPHGHNQKSPAIMYVNVGDPYHLTVMWYNGSFHVGCWGYIVEQGHYD
jgi:hypothetical protein